MALRLGRPDLASAALDGAGGGSIEFGLYGEIVPLIERRLELASLLEDPWELGDIFAMSGWLWTYLGDYRRAAELAGKGAERVMRDAPGTGLHCLNWQGVAEFHLGNWTTVIDEILPKVRETLGDRR